MTPQDTIEISPSNASTMSSPNSTYVPSRPSTTIMSARRSRPSTSTGQLLVGNGGSTDELNALVEDQLVMLQTMHR